MGGGVWSNTCGKHAGSAGVGVEQEGCCSSLLYAGPAVWGSGGTGSTFLYEGFQSRQHLLRPHQHPLTPVWHFHSCGVTTGSDGLGSVSTYILPHNCMSG